MRVNKLKLPGQGNLNPSCCYQFDAGTSNRCPEPGEESQVSRRAPEGQHNGTPASKSAALGTQLKCPHANMHIMASKQEELKMCARLQGYDLTGITEMWWDGSYSWSVGIEGYRLLRRGRQGRRGGGVTLCVSDELECTELCLGWMRSQPRAYGSGLKGQQGQVML